MTTYCHDPRHATPCPQPCLACQMECDPKYLKGASKGGRMTSIHETYADAHPTSLSKLTDADWHGLSARWNRGIDWNVGKLGSRWVLTSEHFSAFPLYRTKSAAHDAGEALILAEARWRGYQRLIAEGYE